MRAGRAVLPSEESVPVKSVAPKELGRKGDGAAKVVVVGDGTAAVPTVALYGPWQTTVLQRPAMAGNTIPKNKHGEMAWLLLSCSGAACLTVVSTTQATSRSCIPIVCPRAAYISRIRASLQLRRSWASISPLQWCVRVTRTPCAAAVCSISLLTDAIPQVGFEKGPMGFLPQYSGVIVTEASAEALLAAYETAEQVRVEKSILTVAARVKQRWQWLARGVLLKKRVDDRFLLLGAGR